MSRELFFYNADTGSRATGRLGEDGATSTPFCEYVAIPWARVRTPGLACRTRHRSAPIYIGQLRGKLLEIVGHFQAQTRCRVSASRRNTARRRNRSTPTPSEVVCAA
jgi:hypothetical protein